MIPSYRDYVLNYLKPSLDQPHHYELIESHLLYLDKTQSVSYLQAMQNAQYSSGFHADLVAIMNEQSTSIIAPYNHLALIDLGPGYPDKTLPLMQAAFQQRKPLAYRPVDISDNYLEIATQAAQAFTNDIKPIQSLFETCMPLVQASLDNQPDLFKIAYVGLTFMNMPPHVILPILKNLSQPHGLSAFATELITPDNTIEKIRHQYQNDAVYNVAFGPLRHLGLSQTECQPQTIFNPNTSRIEIGFTIPKGYFDDDIRYITTVISHRYTREALENVITTHFPNHTLYFPSQTQNTVLATAFN